MRTYTVKFINRKEEELLTYEIESKNKDEALKEAKVRLKISVKNLDEDIADWELFKINNRYV